MPGIYQPGQGPNGIVETPINTQAGAFNVYVGERYVPLLADPIEWTNQISYEPLTIVIYQGNSYTSRQYVPIGVDITNTTYWAQTGNFNGQLLSIQQNINSIITENESQATDINAIKSNLTSLNQSTNNLQNQINKNGNWLNSYYLFLGDSYGAGGETYDGALSYGWCNYIEIATGLTTSHFKTIAKGGVAFVDVGNGTYASLLDQVSSDFANKVQYVICQTAGNDTASASAQISAIGQFNAKCKQMFPNLNKIIFVPLYWKPASAKTFGEVQQQVYYYMQASNSCLVPSCSPSIMHYSGHRLPGNQHLTEGGAQYLAYCIANFIKGVDNTIYLGAKTLQLNVGNSPIYLVTDLYDNTIYFRLYGDLNGTFNTGSLELLTLTYGQPTYLHGYGATLGTGLLGNENVVLSFNGNKLFLYKPTGSIGEVNANLFIIGTIPTIMD